MRSSSRWETTRRRWPPTIESALEEKSALLWLTDSKGKRLGIPTDKLAYVEIAGADADRKVGFGAR